MFNSIFGFPVTFTPDPGRSQPAQNQTLQSWGQQSQLGQNQLNAYNQHQPHTGQHAANMLAQQQKAFNAAQLGQLGQLQHRYMINGRSMNFDQFLDELCPESDDPMRTFLILKYKGTNNG